MTAVPATHPPRRIAALSWRRLVRSPNLVVGAAVLALVVGAAIFAPQIAPHSPIDQAFTDQLRPPSPPHLFGTDEFGRDIFSRVLYGARIALVIGVLADGIALALGVVLGVVSGYFGGRVDAVVMRSVDVLLAFPYLLLAMVVVTILGPSLINAMIAIGIVYTPQFARLVRAAVLAIKEQEFVEAAGALGAGVVRVLGRHILPNILSPIIVMATLTAEWGSMLATGRSFMLTAPWIATFPGLAILVTVVGFNLMGDGLRDLLDPRLRGRG
ncbi:MAG: ABC transporter permease [Bacillati bacterium ANGP1]|uniref:ABC transporter permease n=1 Tax=Candidatus Segetimicrobium genomatis TaxID=2569760 RepID=A0A537M300_9BACT|nr:MAG: ABC transporter permease [Terrabacteria group bacterium ANGP1]